MADFSSCHCFVSLQTTTFKHYSCPSIVKVNNALFMHLALTNSGQLIEMLLQSTHVARFSAVHVMQGPYVAQIVPS